MRGKKVKAIKRKVRQHQDQIIANSIEATLKEPWPTRVKTGFYIASGGNMILARVVTWIVVGLTVWNAWQIIY